jgi:hypothetical protein
VFSLIVAPPVDCLGWRDRVHLIEGACNGAAAHVPAEVSEPRRSPARDAEARRKLRVTRASSVPGTPVATQALGNFASLLVRQTFQLAHQERIAMKRTWISLLSAGLLSMAVTLAYAQSSAGGGTGSGGPGGASSGAASAGQGSSGGGTAGSSQSAKDDEKKKGSKSGSTSAGGGGAGGAGGGTGTGTAGSGGSGGGAGGGR